MTFHFRPAELDMDDLKQRPLAPPSATPIEPAEILTRNKILHISEDKKVIWGQWECAPGASRWEYDNRQEIVYVLSGSMTVQEDGGEPVKLEPGASAVFPVGWRGTWTVHETFRKVYVVYRP
ncbi:cupin domain-containing protein [Pseudonocardia acaciae]|uniref:cupin domain-containing protein n=1 Tax=Pseudonocardia acaciae TaxID=551276 RepID=UPI00048B809C|nr:cupin domain-containing protein [Pseudonocardia acaciae]